MLGYYETEEFTGAKCGDRGMTFRIGIKWDTTIIRWKLLIIDCD